MFCTWSAGRKTTVLLAKDVDGSTIAETFTDEQGVNAYGLRMVYEPTDITTAAASSSEPAPSSTADSNNESGGSGGLSTGATVAIGVVFPVVVIIALACLLFWYRRRKRGPDPEPPGAAINDPMMGDMGGYGGKQPPPSEMDSWRGAPFQGTASPHIVELHEGSRLSELPTYPPGASESGIHGQGMNARP